MTQILIILQGLLYTGLVVTLANGRAQRRWPGPRGVLAAAGASLALHLLLTLAIPAEWRATWLFFVIPGHILTPALLVWLARRNAGE
jgi:predicted MFS family arabinose efflux permease